jgi:hypothetical protein
VLEETGYNLAGQINPDDVIEVSIQQQQITLFIVPGVPEDYPFETKTRKEISVRRIEIQAYEVCSRIFRGSTGLNSVIFRPGSGIRWFPESST